MRAALLALVLLAACATAPAATDQTLEGAVTAQAPRASFPIPLDAGQVVTLTTTLEGDFDSVLTLIAPNGEQVAENDDQAEGDLSSRIIHRARTAGTYTAIVTGYNGAAGEFGLNVAYGLDLGLSHAARTISENTVSFGPQRTEARYDATLAAGDIFVASTFAFTENLDTTLSLLDASGAVLRQNDDRGDGTLNSQIVYQIETAGRFTIVASTYGGNGVGDAAISLAVDPQARPPFDFAAIEGAPLATHEGALNAETPSREYTLQLTAGQTILALADTTSGDLDPVLRLNDSDGYPVALNDDRGDGSLNAGFAFTAPRTAAYTLIVERYRGADTSGEYRIALTNVDASVVATLQALLEDAVQLSGPELHIQTEDFNLYYTTEGEDASTHEYARLTADALQSLFTRQVREMGWAEPVRDEDGRYRAYVAQANGSMGYTAPVQIVFDNPNTPNVRERAVARTVFVIDNDFRGMQKEAPPESLMRATATHEFNHVIQFGYDSEEGLNWLYEATASWIETTTVGVDQDATEYTETDFAAPQRCWTTNTEGHDYAQWTLLQSLSDQHGPGIVTRIWENAVAHDGFDTMSVTLSGVRSTIPQAIERWRAQNFARDYALAPVFPRAVHLARTITEVGEISPKNGVEQLGAAYVALDLDGRYTFSVDGDPNLELVGLGQRNGQIEVVRLGRGGVFDTSAFEHPTLMVFHRAVPQAPGDCTEVRYRITTAPTTRAMGRAAYQFSAANFQPPGWEREPSTDEEAEAETE